MYAAYMRNFYVRTHYPARTGDPTLLHGRSENRPCNAYHILDRFFGGIIAQNEDDGEEILHV